MTHDLSSARIFFSTLALPLAAGLMVVICGLFFGPRGPLVALMLNAFLLSEVAGFSQVFALPMPAGYFRPRGIEQPWIYERLGIRAFKSLMRSHLYRRINPTFRLSGGRRGLGELSERMQSAEAAHLLAFLLVSAFAFGALLVRWVDAAVWLTLFNVLLNAYPVMLQRYNRLRLEALPRS